MTENVGDGVGSEFTVVDVGKIVRMIMSAWVGEVEFPLLWGDGCKCRDVGMVVTSMVVAPFKVVELGIDFMGEGRHCFEEVGNESGGYGGFISIGFGRVRACEEGVDEMRSEGVVRGVKVGVT